MNKISTGLIDHDALSNKKDFFYDLDIMKLASYYRTKREITKLLLIPSEYSQYTRTYFIKNRFDYKTYDKIFKDSRILYRGYAFAPEGYNPLPDDIELSKPDITIYDTYLKFNDSLPNRREPHLHALQEDCHARLSTNGEDCNVDLNHIYYKESDNICLHDFNVLSLKGWKETLDNFKDKMIKIRFPPITDKAENVKYILENYKIQSENHLILSSECGLNEINDIIALGKIYKDKIKVSILENLNITNIPIMHNQVIEAMNIILSLKRAHVRVHGYIDTHNIDERSCFLNNIIYWSNRNHGDTSFSDWLHNIRHRCEVQFDALAASNETFKYLYTVLPSQFKETM